MQARGFLNYRLIAGRNLSTAYIWDCQMASISPALPVFYC